MSPRHAALAIFAAAALAAPCARADAESDAKDLFERGRELRAAGNCAQAAPLFVKAHEVFPAGLGSLRNAAECEEQLGRWATARRSWLELARELMFAHDAKYAGWQADADDAAKRLAPRVAHLTVEVAGARGAAPAVTVDGDPLKPELVGTALDRDPGHYVVAARLGDREAHAAVDLVTGGSQTVRLDFSEAVAAATVRATHAAHASSAWTPVGWVTMTIGIAALAGMGVAIAVRQDALSAVDSKCPLHVACPIAVKSDADRGAAASTAATALAIAGGILAGAGIAMLVVGASSTHREGVALRLSPWGASLEGRF